jgi:signal transduction histidine kinase/DNA-binding response OmpR family regulator
MLNKQLFSFFFLCIIPIISFSQSFNIDSLEQVAHSHENDSVKLWVMSKLGWYYADRDFDKSIQKANEILELATSINRHVDIANAYNLIGYTHDAQNANIEEVIVYFEKAIYHYDQIGDEKRKANILSNIGLAYRRVGNYPKAFSYNLQAVEIGEALGDTSILIYTINNMAIIYRKIDENEKAKQYYLTSLAYAEATDNQRMIKVVCNNLGNIYHSLNESDSALIFFNRTLSISKKRNYDYGITLGLANIGKVYIQQKKYDLANETLEEAYKYAIELDNNLYLQALVTGYLGGAAFHQKNYTKAVRYTKKGIEKLGSNGEISTQLGLYKRLAKSYEKLGQLPLALENYKISQSLRDSIYHQERQTQISKLDIKYETAKKEEQLKAQQLELSRKTNQRNIFITVAIIFLALGWYFWQLSHRLKANKKTIESQTKELQRLYDDKNRFFANIAHELRTPLTLIAGPIAHVIKTTQLPTITQKSLNIANRNVTYLKQLVNQILDLSKKEVDELSLQVSVFDFSDMLQTVVEDFQPFAQYQKINFQTPNNIEKTIPLTTDGEKLFIVLKNLLSNAFKYTNSGGQVMLNYVEIGGTLQISIQDTGKGILEKDLEHVFKPYFQTSNINAPIEGGTGIGLAICKEYIEQLQGSIQVNSELGKGSIFMIQFPKQLANLPISETTNLSFLQKNQPQITTSSMVVDLENASSVLIVEDNLDICQYLQIILQEEYQITFANNGEEGLLQLEKNPPDLILTDLMMPVMDGFEFIEKVKSQDKWRPIPIITLTARSEMMDKLHALRIGVDDYLVKPFLEDELKIRIENLLKNSENRQVFLDEIQEKIELTHPKKEPSEAKVTKPTITMEDAEWLKSLEEIVNRQINNVNFNVSQLCLEMAVSTSQLYQKLKKLTGLTPKQYIDQIRYAKARKLLETQVYGSIKRVAYEVGFKDEKNFSRNFKKRFGTYPSTYLN